MGMATSTYPDTHLDSVTPDCRIRGYVCRSDDMASLGVLLKLYRCPIVSREGLLLAMPSRIQIVGKHDAVCSSASVGMGRERRAPVSQFCSGLVKSHCNVSDYVTMREP